MKYFIRVYVFIIVYNVLYSLCLLGLYGNGYELVFNNSKRGNSFVTIFHRLKNKNHELRNKIFDRSRIKSDSRETMYDNHRDYRDLYIRDNRTYYQDLESSETYDTLTQSDIVRNQYMTLPYPLVSDQQLVTDKYYYDHVYPIRKIPYMVSFGISFEALNHYLYQGRNTFRSEFRAIFPGGGTGGGVPYMAEQMNNTNSEVVYFDFSKTSMNITQFQIKSRRCSNVVWVLDWIESIPRLGLGKFDFTISTGVLHHLKSPQKGLNIVNDGQLESGGAEFMVYGKYGRTGVYQVQELLRIINQNEQGLRHEIQNAKTILHTLPNYHWFATGDLSDHNTMGDIGIYDLLLHKRDVAFTKLDLYSWLEKGGYNVVDFSHAENAIPISLKTIVDDGPLLEKLTRMNTPVPHAIGEIICGIISKQDVYVSKQQNSVATLSSTEDVVYTFGSPLGFRLVMNEKSNYRKLRNETFVFTRYHRIQKMEEEMDSKSFRYKDDTYTGDFIWPSTEFNDFVISTLTRKPLRPKTLLSIITDFNQITKTNVTFEKGSKLFNDLFLYIKDFKIFFFKHKSIPSFPLTCCFNLYTVFSPL